MSDPREPEGWVVPLLVGVDGKTMTTLLGAGLPLPTPVRVRGLIDTGSDITGVSLHVVNQLGLAMLRRASTSTVSGTAMIELFEVSLSIVTPASPPATFFVLNHLEVMRWPAPPAGLDALLGLDVLDQLLAITDGPGKVLTLAD